MSSTQNVLLGQPHRCHECGKKFYDLNKPAAACPYCTRISCIPGSTAGVKNYTTNKGPTMFNEMPLLEEGLPHHDPEQYTTNGLRLLDNLDGWLSEEKLVLPAKDRDGRTNSKLHETIIVKAIRDIFPGTDFHAEGYDFDIPEERKAQKKIRDWYDIMFYRQHSGYDREIIPVDIKSSAMGASGDNGAGKLGLFYALTGKEPHFSNGITWPKYMDELADWANPQSAGDMFFIGVDKSNTQKVRAYSLKTLVKLTPNSNNLPFQIKWKDNHDRIYRFPQEAYDFLRDGFLDSVERSNMGIVRKGLLEL